MKKILVVDDTEGIRNLLRSLLESAGFAVEEAENGVAALALLHAKQFACVITDLEMPEMDGKALAERTKVLFPQIPVIMATGNRAAAEGAPVFGIVGKPFKNKEVLKLIQFVTGESMR